ncbi:MAG TPA: glycerol-3-phosphate 1-O-acyltransferase PlsY [Alphaproteobacteria bacterium]|jgi:glycerol-3-phosphate acyltransferase PlsY|nr:glycerol-3-phosphate 1-O-acyltransferase PlsY [Alphaproteobacteria bacterium]
MPDPISWSFVWPYFLAAFAGAYLLGSIPFGLVVTRAAGLGDIRAIGSGNIGATNVLRTGRKWLAALTLALDGAKGALAVLLAQQWGPDMGLMAGYGALVGHMFPVWLRFKGGKGMATALGIWLVIALPVGLAACATWLVVAALSRYSSLASLLSLAASPLYAWYISGDLQLVQFGIIVTALVWTRHHANLRRLLTGQESRIGRTK